MIILKREKVGITIMTKRKKTDWQKLESAFAKCDNYLKTQAEEIKKAKEAKKKKGGKG